MAIMLIAVQVPASGGGTQAHIKKHSMQQLLGSREKYINEKVSVIGYLSANCSGLCMFAYKDDAESFNVSNSIQLILDGETITHIDANCSERYVSIIGLIDHMEGFYFPGFVHVESIRIMKPATTVSEICWPESREKH
jgi:hypothetical protein